MVWLLDILILVSESFESDIDSDKIELLSVVYDKDWDKIESLSVVSDKDSDKDSDEIVSSSSLQQKHIMS